MTTIIVLGSNMTNMESITGKQFVLENMHAEANFVSVLAGDEELPVSWDLAKRHVVLISRRWSSTNRQTPLGQATATHWRQVMPFHIRVSVELSAEPIAQVSFPQLTNDDGEVFMTDTQKVMVRMYVDREAC
jgi:hypothetical protein